MPRRNVGSHARARVWASMFIVLGPGCSPAAPGGAGTDGSTTGDATDPSGATSTASGTASTSSTAAASTDATTATASDTSSGDDGAGDPVPAWREGLDPLTWTRIGASVPRDVDPEADPAINPNYPDPAPWRSTNGGGDIVNVWEAWSGAAWDETTGTLFVHGGGHNDYAGNEVYTQRLFDDAPIWSLERPPTGAIGNTGLLDDFQELTAVYFDGRPRSNHSYDNLLAIDGALWLAIVAAPFRSGGATGLATFKLVAGDWQTVQTGEFPAGGAGAGGAGSACHDTARDRIYYWPSQNSEISYWDLAAGTSTTLPLITAAGQQSRALYVPELDLQVVLNGSYTAQFGIYDYDRTVSDAPLQPGATGTPPEYAYGAGWWYPNGVWAPGFGDGVGAILCWHGGTGLWALTPPSRGNPATTPWAWSRVEAAPTNTIDPGQPNDNGIFGRFFYSQGLNGVGLSLGADEATYFLALP